MRYGRRSISEYFKSHLLAWSPVANSMRRGRKQNRRFQRLCVESLEPRRVLAGDFEWAVAIGSEAGSSGAGYATAVDALGNVFVTGVFSGTADFDPGSGTANLTSAGSADVFVVKYGAAGNYLWAKQLGGTNNDFGNDLAVDSAGNILVAGDFSGTADFDPGAGVAALSSGGYGGSYVVKLDSDGNYIWAKQFSAASGSIPFSKGLAIDGSDNVVVTGGFQGTVDFDPGAGAANLTANNYDIFVVKLNLNGDYVWANQFGSSNGDFGRSVAVDSSDNILVNGDFYGTVDFDPGVGTSNLTAAVGTDIFIAKYDAFGNYVWVRQFAGANYEQGRSVAVDYADNVVVNSAFTGTIDFDPGAGVADRTSAGGDDVFVVKLDSAGDYVWANALGSSHSDGANRTAVDDLGNIFVTGYFQDTVDFDPGAGTAELTSAGGADIFVVKFNSAGGYAWAERMGGTAMYGELGNGVAVDAADNALVTGYFNGTVDFDPGAGDSSFTASNTAGFIVKLSGNIAPNLATNTGLVIDEGTAATIGGALLQTTDLDGTASQLVYTVAVAPTEGALFKNDTALASNETFTQADIDAGHLTYTHDGGETTSDSFTFTVADGSGGAIAATTFVITINAVNDAPVLDSARSPGLTSLLEDSGAPAGPVGTLVADLVDFASPVGQTDNVTDNDIGAQIGIAVTAAATSHGTWFYSLDDGANWSALGAVADDGARLLAADASTRLYFQPHADYNGTLDGALTFRAWDRSAGNNGDLADTTTAGGATAFSMTTDTASLVVTAVNDAPNFTKGPDLTVRNNGGLQTLAGWATNILRGPADENGQLLDFLVTNDNAGLFAAGGAPVIAADGTLSFTPAVGAAGTGIVTVRLHDSGGGTDLSAPQTFTITVANRLLSVIRQPPTSIAAGAAFGLTIAILNTADGKTLTTYNGPVMISLGANPGGATLGVLGAGTLTVVARNGVATFNNLTLNKASAGYNLQVSAAGMSTATTNAVTVVPAAPTQMTILSQPPALVTAGNPFGFSVQVFDRLGNLATNYGGNLNVSIAVNPVGGRISGPIGVRVVNGVAQFNGLSLDKSAAGYKLQVSGVGSTPLRTDALAVQATTAVKLIFTTQPPPNVTAGVGFTVVARTLDRFNNLATGFNGDVQASLYRNPGFSILGGTTRVAAVNGVVTMTGLDLNKAANGYLLQLTSAGLPTVVTGGVNVRPATAAQLVVTTQPPTSVVAGTTFKIVVTARDAFGNTATGFTGNLAVVTSAPGSNPGGATLGGTLAMNAGNGMATFGNLTLNKVGVGYTLQFTAAGLPVVVTNPLNVTVAAASQFLLMTPPPTTVAAGTPFAFSVQVADRFGNFVTAIAKNAFVTLAAAPAGGTLGGAPAVGVPLVGGAATFTDLSLNKVGVGYKLRVTASGLPVFTTGAITVV